MSGLILAALVTIALWLSGVWVGFKLGRTVRIVR